MRRLFAAATVAGLMAAAFAPAQAGDLPTWTNIPTQGPSPNNTHTVSGTECNPASPRTSVEPQGIAIRGQAVALPNTVTVRLFHPGPGAEIRSETFNAQLDGTWSVLFEIPPGLPAGVYPLTARCNGFEVAERAAGLLAAPVLLAGAVNAFNYAPDRSYTVIAQADPPDPVEAEVTFTG